MAEKYGDGSREIGNRDTDVLEEARKRRLLIDRCDAYLFEQIRPFMGRRVLEVGCGHGNLTSHLLDRDLVVASDLDPSSLEIVRRRFAEFQNVVTELVDIASPVSGDLRKYTCDTIISLNVLEHIEDDDTALSNMAKMLAPNGHVILIVPAFQGLFGTMDASIGHYRRYTKSDLSRKLRTAGLQVEQQSYFNLLGILGWFVNGRLLHRTVAPASQLRLYNLIFPIAVKLESFLPSIVGLSLISISRRM